MDELQEFERYMVHLSGGLGHADRHAGLRGYCTGLMAPLKRKGVLTLTELTLAAQSGACVKKIAGSISVVQERKSARPSSFQMTSFQRSIHGAI